MNLVPAKMSEAVDVYILQAKDLFRFALCFGTSVYEFTPQDDRGPVGCLRPLGVSADGITWRTSSRVKISEVDANEWSSSIHCATMTTVQFTAYRRWLQEWLEVNRYYTLIEGGSNIRKFITDSLAEVQRLDAAMDKRLFLPEICTYTLEYSSKEMCSASDLHSIAAWYGDLLAGSLHQVMHTLNSLDTVYYHETSSQGEQYWRIIRPVFRLRDGKILLPSRRSVSSTDVLLSLRDRITALPITVDSVVTALPITVVSLPITVVSLPITTIPVPAGLLPAGGGGTTMLVIIILIAVLILVIFFAIVYYASYRGVRAMPMPMATAVMVV